MQNSQIDRVIKKETGLKELIVQYVGENKNPENEEVTIQHIAEVFTEQFPEFLLVLAEENWINGYTQALKDVDFLRNQSESPKGEEGVTGES